MNKNTNKKYSHLHSYDVLGNIVIVKFPKEAKAAEKKRFAEKILANNKSIKTILEKVEKFKGKLRKQKTKWLLGEKTKEALYKENGCVFRFNVDKVYFSPRLSNERKEVASMINNGKVLVMFAGVGPYSIVIAKNSKAKVFSNEINREANEYAKLNVQLNKVKDKVFLLPGNIKKIVEKIKKGFELKINSRKISVPKKFDYIVMPRPKIKDSFLKQAFLLSKKGTIIYYYDFCKENEIEKIIEKIKQEALKKKRKIEILKVKKAGEIAPYEFRIRVDFKILN